MSVVVDQGAYVCPRSGSALRMLDGQLKANDSSSFPIRKGVPSFLKYESVESDEDRERLERLNQLAESVGCVEALKQTYGEGANIFGYVTDTSRHIVVDLLPLDKSMRLLEIGSGLGQFTTALAKRCAHVIAMEIVEEQAVFTRIRCQKALCDNADVVAGGDDCLLPYPYKAFDGVVLNLVLEWCGMRAPQVPLIESQRR